MRPNLICKKLSSTLDKWVIIPVSVTKIGAQGWNVVYLVKANIFAWKFVHWSFKITQISNNNCLLATNLIDDRIDRKIAIHHWSKIIIPPGKWWEASPTFGAKMFVIDERKSLNIPKNAFNLIIDCSVTAGWKSVSWTKLVVWLYEYYFVLAVSLRPLPSDEVSFALSISPLASTCVFMIKHAHEFAIWSR